MKPYCFIAVGEYDVHFGVVFGDDREEAIAMVQSEYEDYECDLYEVHINNGLCQEAFFIEN